MSVAADIAMLMMASLTMGLPKIVNEGNGTADDRSTDDRATDDGHRRNRGRWRRQCRGSGRCASLMMRVADDWPRTMLVDNNWALDDGTAEDRAAGDGVAGDEHRLQWGLQQWGRRRWGRG